MVRYIPLMWSFRNEATKRDQRYKEESPACNIGDRRVKDHLRDADDHTSNLTYQR